MLLKLKRCTAISLKFVTVNLAKVFTSGITFARNTQHKIN